MGRYTVSMKPRLGAAAIMAEILAPKPLLASSTQIPSIPSPKEHHQSVDLCQWAQSGRNRDTNTIPTQPPLDKRRKVTIEEVPDEDAPTPVASTPNPTTSSNGERLRRYKGLYVEEFPDPLAGAPISSDRLPAPNLTAYMRSCGPMADPDCFEVAELLMTSGLSNKDKERHLKSKMYKGKTPWGDCDALLSDVDKLAHGPEFELYEIDLFDGRRPRPQFMVCRDIIKIIRDFFANRAFEGHIRYKPWRLFTSASKKERVYGDMAGSDWWWRELEKLIARGQRNATIAPLIIATDQTTLSIMCGGQKAYPVYVSFGNLDKDWRRKPSKRGMYLLGYLPVDSLEDVADDERKRLKAELVHRAMEKMLEPLRVASEQGVEMWCPDGRLRRIYPRVAAYTADWPEQNLQCCTSEGGCPVCKTTHKERGKFEDEADLREREETLHALRTYILTKNGSHLDLLKLKPVWPWWGDMPDVNLPGCITPDLLHQAYQGIFKTHLVPWMKTVLGVDVLDKRFAAMPQAEGLKRFTGGISAIAANRWTGRESKELLQQFLPALAGDLKPEMMLMVRALVDFMYRAHATTLTDADLHAMEHDLATFHELKDVLVGPVYDEGTEDKRFNKIAKLHMLRHWTHSIRELGTPDGYNTEGPEHLHIEYAKIPWRASNKVKPLPQMIKYIQRQEAIRIHRSYLDQYLARDRDEDQCTDDADEYVELINHCDSLGDEVQGYESINNIQVPGCVARDEADNEDDPGYPPEPIAYPNPCRRMAATPTASQKSVQEVVDNYHALDIISATTTFLVHRCGVPRHDVLLSRQHRINLWHKIYLYHPPPSFAPFDPVRRDVVRAHPATRSTGNREPGVWDVALFLEKPNRYRSSRDDSEKHGIKRYRAGRVRALFTLPANLQLYYPGPLAYLELFTPFDAPVSPFNMLHSTKPDIDSHGRRRTLVIPVSDMILACHLVPKYRLLDPELALHSYTDLLSISQHFWLNHYYNHHFFQFIQHWRRRRTLLERLVYNVQRSLPRGS